MIDGEPHRRNGGSAGAPGDTPGLDQQTLNALGGAVVVTDARGSLLTANQAFEHATGYSGSELVGRPVWSIVTPEEERAAAQARIDQILDSRRPGLYEGHFQTKGGARRCMVWSDAPQLDGSGNVRAIVSTGLDCTPHRRLIEWQQFLSEADTVLSSSLELKDALKKLADLAVPRFADWCVIYLMEGEGQVERLAVAHVGGDAGRDIAAVIESAPPRIDRLTRLVELLRSGEPALVSTVSDDFLEAFAADRDHLNLLRRIGIRSGIIVPLCSRRRLLGAITFVSAGSGRSYNQEDLVHAQELSRRAALAADNARLYAESQDAARRYEESLAQLDLVLQSAPVGFAFLDRDLRYVRINRYLAEYDGASVDAHLGRTICEMIPPDRAAEIAPLLLKVIETGQPLEGTEVPMEPPGRPGEITHWLSSYYPVRAADGDVIGVGAIAVDITDRRKAENALRASEERFRTLVEQISDWIWEVDRDGFYSYVSPRVRDLLGYEPEELIGKRPFDLMPHDEAERLIPIFRKIAEEQRPFSGMENRNCRKDGRIVVLETSGIPIVGDDGALLGYRGIDRDITERKNVEETQRFLAEASRILTSSLESGDTLADLAHICVPRLGDWCIIYTVDEYEQVHRAAIRYADPARAALADRLMTLPAPSLAQIRPLVEALRAGRPQHMPVVPEAVLQALSTSPAHLQLLHQLGARSALVVPLQARGKLLGVIHLFLTEPGRKYSELDVALAQDLAGRAAVAFDNARLYHEAREANAAKDQFLAVLSHELRNPLAPILAGVGVLRQVLPEDGRAQRTIAIIERNVRLQARLVNDLLDLSRIRRGKIRLQRMAVTLDSPVHAAAQAAQPDAEDAGLALHVDTIPGLWVLGDPDRLQQVVMNLLSNAIKFTPPPGEIRVTLEETDGTARIIVSDTGIGISSELLPDLFNMFQQGEVAGRRAAGLGIGLALVRSITEMHGGRVWAESEGPGTGSRFTVEIPLIPTPEAATTSGPAGTEARTQVLLLEDNPDTRTLLAEGLRASGYDVYAAATGEEALEWLSEHRPCVIVADIGLPGMDGYEFLRQARGYPHLRGTAAFAVTGYGGEDDVERARTAGYDAHFTKPVDVGVLAKRIREQLAGAPAPAAQ